MILIRDIQASVAAWTGVSVMDMRSRRQAARVCRARHIAMYLAREFTPHSFPEIGRYFGGRDHTSVMSAVKGIQSKRAQDDELNCLVRGFEMVLGEQLEREAA